MMRGAFGTARGLACCALIGGAVLLASAYSLHAQTAPAAPPAPVDEGPAFQGPPLAMDRVISRAVESLTVTSPTIPSGASIPDLYTGAGKDISPPLAWPDAPAATGAFVVIVEDPDAHTPMPFLHWLGYNIPGDRRALPRNVHNQAEPRNVKGMEQGLNSAGGVGWYGPHPPLGDPPHHYHFEVFALDKPLKVGPKATREKLIAAMDDHVLAEGELVATYQTTPPAAPKAKK